MKITGGEKKDPPMQFDEMHQILGNKDTYLEGFTEITELEVNTGVPSTSKQKDIKNRYYSNFYQVFQRSIQIYFIR